jgi:hypothetical protein
MKIITNRISSQSLEDFASVHARTCISVHAVVAFVTSHELLEAIANNSGAEVRLIIALVPPTSYYTIEQLYRHSNIHIRFVHTGLHTKFYLFESPQAKLGIIGSSNLTPAGFRGNIETNVLFFDDEVVKFDLQNEFNQIEKHSEELTPEVLHAYKKVYDDFVTRNPRERPPQPEKKPLALRTKSAKTFVRFWSGVDHASKIIGPVTNPHLAVLPVFVAIDHFWHFVVSITKEEKVAEIIRDYGRDDGIRTLFKEYGDWYEQHAHAENLLARVEVAQRLLQPERLAQLTESEAKEIYHCLHSNSMPIKRFARDEKFVKENSLQDIIETFRALLHDKERRIEYRIDEALTKKKLRHFGPSNVQELNGWFSPDSYPLRNNKADKALRMLHLAS